MTLIIEMVRASRLKEVWRFGEGLTTPYVPAAGSDGRGMPEAVDWQLTGCGDCEPDLRIGERCEEVGTELLANSPLSFFDLNPVHLRPS